MALQLGDEAPNFQAQTTEGQIDFRLPPPSSVVTFARRLLQSAHRSVTLIGHQPHVRSPGQVRLQHPKRGIRSRGTGPLADCDQRCRLKWL